MSRWRLRCFHFKPIEWQCTFLRTLVTCSTALHSGVASRHNNDSNILLHLAATVAPIHKRVYVYIFFFFAFIPRRWGSEIRIFPLPISQTVFLHLLHMLHHIFHIYIFYNRHGARKRILYPIIRASIRTRVPTYNGCCVYTTCTPCGVECPLPGMRL